MEKEEQPEELRAMNECSTRELNERRRHMDLLLNLDCWKVNLGSYGRVRRIARGDEQSR